MADKELLKVGITILKDLSMKKGYITFDDILDVTDKFELPLDDVDRISDSLLTVGIIIRENDKQDVSKNDNTDTDYIDRSKLDYNLIYQEVLELDPLLESYIKEIKHIPAPQLREVDNLIHQAIAGNKYAYDRIIKMYLKVVVRIALWASKKYYLPISDTIQDGNIGLIRAFESFDPNSDKRFSIIAPWWIRQNIVREANVLNSVLYFPVHLKDELFAIYDTVIAHSCIYCKEGYICSNLVKEVSTKNDFEQKKAKLLITYLQPFFSIEEMLEINENIFTDNMEFEESLMNNVENLESADHLRSILGRLTAKEAEVLTLRFGLIDSRERTLEEVGVKFNVTRERIRQIEAKAVRKLRGVLSKNMD